MMPNVDQILRVKGNGDFIVVADTHICPMVHVKRPCPDCEGYLIIPYTKYMINYVWSYCAKEVEVCEDYDPSLLWFPSREDAQAILRGDERL